MTANHIARTTAKRLMPKFGDGLPFAVEKVIQNDTTEESGQSIDLGTLAAIATLVVQCAQFAFEWKRSKGGEGKVDIVALKRELQKKMNQPEGISREVRDDVIEAAAGETGADGE